MLKHSAFSDTFVPKASASSQYISKVRSGEVGVRLVYIPIGLMTQLSRAIAQGTLLCTQVKRCR